MAAIQSVKDTSDYDHALLTAVGSHRHAGFGFHVEDMDPGKHPASRSNAGGAFPHTLQKAEGERMGGEAAGCMSLGAHQVEVYWHVASLDVSTTLPRLMDYPNTKRRTI